MKTKLFNKLIVIIFFTYIIIPGTLFGEQTIKKLITNEYPSLDKLYKHLHANPELSFHEFNTSKRVAEELKKAGFTVTLGVGKFGVVGVLKNGPGKTVMYRTDMDALPVKEKTGLSYASKAIFNNPSGKKIPVMHACGHDIHMTVFTGTARLLSKLRDRWSGTVVLIGQPAEEIGSGARAMINDGLFKRFPRPDYALALHDSPIIPAGMVGTRAGFMLANVDSVNITVNGIGGHGAAPQKTKDPIVIAAQLIMSLQTIVSREVAPNRQAVVTVGAIHGGTKHNIIPDTVELKLTVRSYEDDTRNKIINSIKRISRGIGIAAGLPDEKLPVVKILDEHTPATYNDPSLTKRITGLFKNILGKDNVITTDPVTAGEDFSEYGRVEPKIPIFIYWLGAIKPEVFFKAKKEGKELPGLHSPFWAPDPKPTIKTGIRTMTSAILELLKK